MKNKLLIMAFSLPFFLMAQKTANSKLKPTTVGGAEQISSTKTSTEKINQEGSSVNAQNRPVVLSGLKRSLLPYSFVKIGNTKYDLQTNASMGRRIIVLPNGNISAVWTTSVDASTGFTNRGTGYNSFNGTSWFTNASPTPRLESSVRTGWPSIGVNGTNEWVMGHSAADGGFIMSKNASLGSNSWTSGNLTLTQPQRRPIWGRVMNNGDYFHCISNYADSGAAGEPRAPKINGITAPWTYSRSTDGGATWSTQHILLPGYDGSRYVNGGGDQYAIDVRDSIVVIVSGDLTEDVAIWKSTNNGLTFTKTICDSFKYAPYSTKKLILDTPMVCDGSLDVIIDENGNAHAFWGVVRLLDTDTNDVLFSFFPGTAAMAYWNEITKSVKLIATGAQFDRNTDGNYDIKAGTFASLSNGSIPSTVLSVARLGNTGLIHMPSAGMDASGNIFVSFSVPIEDNLDLNQLNYRDVAIVHSKDKGATWSDPSDISKNINLYDKNNNPIFNEEEFACVARTVNSFVHVIFQSDEIPGTNLQNNASNAGNHPVPDKGNDIMYAAIPVSKLLDGSIDNDPLGIEVVNASREIFIVSQNFPNPFSNNSEVIIWLENESNVTLEITNIQGQVVATQNFNVLSAGNHSLSINGENLASGAYFYTLKTTSNSATQKMMIQH